MLKHFAKLFICRLPIEGFAQSTNENTPQMSVAMEIVQRFANTNAVTSIVQDPVNPLKLYLQIPKIVCHQVLVESKLMPSSMKKFSYKEQRQDFYQKHWFWQPRKVLAQRSIQLLMRMTQTLSKLSVSSFNGQWWISWPLMVTYRAPNLKGFYVIS